MNERILYITENDYNALVAKLEQYESLYMARQETVEVLTDKLDEAEALATRRGELVNEAVQTAARLMELLRNTDATEEATQ